MSTPTYTEEHVHVADIELHLYRGGEGPPLLFLQNGDDTGWLMVHQALAEHFTVYAPSHPGFGITPRLDWLGRINDLSVFYLWLLDTLGLEQVHLLGHGVGGWLAADLATTCPQVVDRLVLADAMGLKPQQSDILDIFLITPEEVRTASFYKPEQVPEWHRLFGHEPTPEEVNRAEDALEMTVRLCWKPYMHDPRLPFLLPRLQRPSLVIWGRQDAIVPVECGELYGQGLADSRLVVLDACGHSPHLEKPQAFGNTVVEFLRSSGE